jgi:uncharacterized membrane protein
LNREARKKRFFCALSLYLKKAQAAVLGGGDAAKSVFYGMALSVLSGLSPQELFDFV